MTARVALVSGGWGQNVGNAFFNLGGRHLLERIFGSGAVQFVQDQPGYRTLHNKLKGNPKNYLDLVRRLEIDYLFLQGPVLNRWMRINWQSTFEELRRNNVRVGLLSSAFFKFTDAEIASVREFLEEHQPALIATRDERSYNILKDWLPLVPKFSGIDSGFFVNECVIPFSIRGDKPYIVLNFDRYPEPTISLDPFNDKGYKATVLEVGDGRQWYLRVPQFLNWASHKSKIWAYIGDLFDSRQLPADIDGFEIFRTAHRFYPHVTHKIYRHPNATASDEPWTFLTIYKNAAFTLSDRVHACVASLAFGRPAMLFTPTPRAALFERVGAKGIRTELTTLDSSRLQEEKEALSQWLRGHV